MDCAHVALFPGVFRQRKTEPDLLCQRRLMAAIERRYLDLAAISAAGSWSSATPTAQIYVLVFLLSHGVAPRFETLTFGLLFQVVL
jgi:hypothetical protein